MNPLGRQLIGNIRRLIGSDDGADIIEYALLAGLISIAAIATLTSVGSKIASIFASIDTRLGGVVIP